MAMEIRGSSSKIVALAMLLLVCFYCANAETHAVGGLKDGVSLFHMTVGPMGKPSLLAIPLGVHNVVPVSAAGYRSCKASSNSKVGTSGDDKFTLRKGPNYFICSIPGHCTAGMKILVVAS